MSRRESKPVESKTSRAPAITPQDRENQLISAAVDLAEQQILAGTASAQVVTHYLKLGSSREKLEQQKLRTETGLLVTKKELMESERRVEDLMINALNAMRSYTGNAPEAIEPSYDDYEE